MTSTIRTIDASTVEVTVELGASDLQGYVRKAEERIGQALNLEGFRKGKAPREAVRQRVGEAQLREEALQVAVQESLSEAIEKEGLDVLDQGNFSIKENTPEKLRYLLTLTLYPNITLGNYKGIEVKKQAHEVTDAELQKVLDDIAASRKTGNTIPELNDEFAKSLGHFTSLEDLKTGIKTGLLQEKELREKDRIRVELLHAVLANSKLHVPDLMIERQLDSVMANFDHQLHEQGLELGPYLAKIKKTQDELRKEWRAKAEDQVKMTLVLHAIGKAEKITISPKELQEALEMRLQQYMAGRQDAGTAEALKDLDLERVKQGLFGSLLNEKIFAFLESGAILTS